MFNRYFLSLFLFLQISCFTPPELMFDQIIEYIPEKAGAEIITKIPFGKYDYVNYQHHQLYALSNGTSADTVTFYDLTNDTVTAKKTVRIPKTTFEDHYSYNSTQCVNIIDDKMILLSNVRDNSADKSFCAMLVFDESDDLFIFYNHSPDFENHTSIYQFYYDDNNHNAYAVTQRYYSTDQKIMRYTYDASEEKFLLCTHLAFQENGYVFLTQNHNMINAYGDNFAVHNDMYIYREYISSSAKRLNLTFLEMEYKPRGAFTDGSDDVWLYVLEDNKTSHKSQYYLVRLKLLDTEASDNEYRKVGCW